MTKTKPAERLALLDAEIADLTAQRETARTLVEQLRALGAEIAALQARRDEIRPLAETKWAAGIDWLAVATAQAELKCLRDHLYNLDVRRGGLTLAAQSQIATEEELATFQKRRQVAEELMTFRLGGTPLEIAQTEMITDFVVEEGLSLDAAIDRFLTAREAEDADVS